MSPEKLKDYSEHHAVTYRARSSPPLSRHRPAHPAAASSQTSRTPTWGKTQRVRRRRCRPARRHSAHACSLVCAFSPRHSEQPHPQVAAVVADLGRPVHGRFERPHPHPHSPHSLLVRSTPPTPAASTLPISSSPSATACRRPATSTRSTPTWCALPVCRCHQHCSLSARAFTDLRQLRLQLRPQQEPVRIAPEARARQSPR